MALTENDMNTIWVDICLGTKEYNEEDDRLVTYVPKISHKIELSKLVKITSRGLDDDFNELRYQIAKTLQAIKKELEYMEKHTNGENVQDLG